MRLPHVIAIVTCFIGVLVQADGPADNVADNVRRIPPPGSKISETDRAELAKGVAELGNEIESLRGELKAKPALVGLLPDVQIYHRAVDWALRYDEVYTSNGVGVATALLREGMAR